MIESQLRGERRCERLQKKVCLLLQDAAMSSYRRMGNPPSGFAGGAERLLESFSGF